LRFPVHERRNSIADALDASGFGLPHAGGVS